MEVQRGLCSVHTQCTELPADTSELHTRLLEMACCAFCVRGLQAMKTVWTSVVLFCPLLCVYCSGFFRVLLDSFVSVADRPAFLGAPCPVSTQGSSFSLNHPGTCCCLTCSFTFSHPTSVPSLSRSFLQFCRPAKTRKHYGFWKHGGETKI